MPQRVSLVTFKNLVVEAKTDHIDIAEDLLTKAAESCTNLTSIQYAWHYRGSREHSAANFESKPKEVVMNDIQGFVRLIAVVRFLADSTKVPHLETVSCEVCVLNDVSFLVTANIF